MHEVYTFLDLKLDMCRLLGMLDPHRSDAKADKAESLELFNPLDNVEWPETLIVLAEMRKPENDLLRGGRVRLRMRPIYHRHAVEDAIDRKAEAELQVEMLSKAQSARRRADALRAIAFERKSSRHARSLTVRGMLHFAFNSDRLFEIHHSFRLNFTHGFFNVVQPTFFLSDNDLSDIWQSL